MPWKGNQDNESQGSHREQSTLLKQMPTLKVRAVYQIIFPNSTHPPPQHGPCRRLNISTWKGDFLSIMFMCLPCILYSSVIFKKLFSLGKTLASLVESSRWPEPTDTTAWWLSTRAQAQVALGWNPISSTYTLAILHIFSGLQFHAMNLFPKAQCWGSAESGRNVSRKWKPGSITE